ncbi:Ig-like domain-containing protein [Luteibaculum oceani]|nr:gliding motility-associated C-terminal domain-containing protein [Luteibaculum oceani]
MIKLKRPLHFISCLVISLFAINATAQNICANRAEVSTDASCIGCGVNNPDSAADCNLDSRATITANLLLSGGATLDLFFDGYTGATGDTVELYVAASNNSALSGTTVSSFGTDGTGMIQENPDGKTLAQLSIVMQGDLLRVRFFPESPFTGVRLNSNAQNGGGNFTLDVAKAHVLKSSGVVRETICEEPNVQTNSLGGTCTANFCEVQNPDAILTESEDDFATINVTAGLLAGTAELTGFWNQLGCSQDSARILLQSNNAPANATITIRALQKDNPGDAGAVVGTRTITALGTGKAEYYIHPGVPFNAVQVEVSVGGGFNNASIRVYAICMKRVTPPQPLNDQRNLTVCFGEGILLQTVPYNNETARWYTQRTGGTPVFTGDNYQTGPLTQDTVIYFEGFIPGAAGCVSSFRDSFAIDVTPTPPAADPFNGTLVACFNEPYTIAPKPEGNVFTFYTTDTTRIITASNFTIPNVLSDTTILVQNTVNGRCGSENLVAANIVLYKEPVVAQVVDTIGICLNPSGQPINSFLPVSVLDESPRNLGTTYRVYNRNRVLIGVGGGSPAEFVFGDSVLLPISQFAINSVGAVDSIFVDAVSGPCTESKNKQKIILIGVEPSTVIPDADDVYACEGENVTLTVNNPQPFQYYYWYDKPVGGSPLYIGTSITIPAPMTEDTLYVEGGYGSFCTSPGRDTVRIVPLSSIGNPFENLSVITCGDSTAVIDLTDAGYPLAEGSTYEWYTQATGGFPVFVGDSFVTPPATAPRTYFLEVSNASCQNRFQVQVDTVSPPDILVNQTLRYACEGDVVILTATSSDNRATFDWYNNPVFGAGNKLSSDNPFNYSPDFTTGDEKDVYVQAVIDQCKSSARSLIKVENITDRQEPVVMPMDTAICVGQSITFNIQPRLVPELVNYSWWDAVNGGNRVSTTASFSTPNLNSSKKYYAQLELADTNVCKGRGRTEVNVDVLPKLATPRLNDKCVADNNNVTYTWNSIPGATEYQYEINITVDGNQQAPQTGTTTNTSYTVSGLQPNSIVEFNLRALGQLNCQTSDQTFKTCVSNECGLDNLSPQQAFYQACEGENVTVGISGVPSDAVVTVLGQPAINNGSGNYSAVVTAADNPSELDITQIVNFTVSLPNANGCDPVDVPVVIRVSPTPEGKITVIALDPAVIGGKIQEYQFIADFRGGDKTWSWDFGDGNTSNEKNPVHKYQDDGVYTVKLEINKVNAGEFACPASAEAEVIVTSIPDLFVPNTFTPNGDGANDEWRVFGRNLDQEGYSVKIFNSYGNVVFESRELDQIWDGTYEGEPAPMGTYYYTLVVFDSIGQKLVREGTINLIRK